MEKYSKEELSKLQEIKNKGIGNSIKNVRMGNNKIEIKDECTEEELNKLQEIKNKGINDSVNDIRMEDVIIKKATIEEKIEYLRKWFNLKTDLELIGFLINHKYKQCQKWDIFKKGYESYLKTKGDDKDGN